MQEKDGFGDAVEAKIRAALPSLQDHEMAVVWMQPGPFGAANREGNVNSLASTPSKKTTPAAYAASALRRYPAHKVAVIAIEWGVHSVSADVSQVSRGKQLSYPSKRCEGESDMQSMLESPPLPIDDRSSCLTIEHLPLWHTHYPDAYAHAGHRRDAG